MAHAITNHAIANHANVISFGDFVSPKQARGLFVRLSRAIADYREYLAIHEELSALTDRELADLGISRLSLRDIARDAVYGR